MPAITVPVAPGRRCRDPRHGPGAGRPRTPQPGVPEAPGGRDAPARAPAARSRSASAETSPPSGPITTAAGRPRSTSRRARGVGAPTMQARIRELSGSSASALSRSLTGSTAGTLARWASSAASRAISPQRRVRAAARTGSGRLTLRWATIGRMTAAPISARAATTSSISRMSACTTSRWRRGSPAAARDQTIAPVTRPGCTAATRTPCSRPASSTTTIRSPGRVRSDAARCRPGSPSIARVPSLSCSRVTKRRGTGQWWRVRAAPGRRAACPAGAPAGGRLRAAHRRRRSAAVTYDPEPWRSRPSTGSWSPTTGCGSRSALAATASPC